MDCYHIPASGKEQSTSLSFACRSQTLHTSLHSHLISQNLVMWPHEATRAAGRRRLYSGWPCVQLKFGDSISKEKGKNGYWGQWHDHFPVTHFGPLHHPVCHYPLAHPPKILSYFPTGAIEDWALTALLPVSEDNLLTVVLASSLPLWTFQRANLIWLHPLEMLQWLPTVRSSEIFNCRFLHSWNYMQILQIYVHFSEQSFSFSKRSLIPSHVRGLNPNSYLNLQVYLLTFLLNLLFSHFPLPPKLESLCNSLHCPGSHGLSHFTSLYLLFI